MSARSERVERRATARVAARLNALEDERDALAARLRVVEAALRELDEAWQAWIENYFAWPPNMDPTARRRRDAAVAAARALLASSPAPTTTGEIFGAAVANEPARDS